MPHTLAIYQYQLLKKMAVQWKEHTTMICVDDKAVMPIGEPAQPMATGVRAHNNSLVPMGSVLAATDHDFHAAGAIPSVLFTVSIPHHGHTQELGKGGSMSGPTQGFLTGISALQGGLGACPPRKFFKTKDIKRCNLACFKC